MATVKEYRRENLRRLIDTSGGVGQLGKKLGYTNGTFLVQMAGPAPIRDVSDQTARKFEAVLDLEPGYLDREVELTGPPVVPPAIQRRVNVGTQAATVPAQAAALDVSKLIMEVGTMAEKIGVSTSPAKFADIVALMLDYAADHTEQQCQEYLERLMRIAK